MIEQSFEWKFYYLSASLQTMACRPHRKRMTKKYVLQMTRTISRPKLDFDPGKQIDQGYHPWSKISHLGKAQQHQDMLHAQS